MTYADKFRDPRWQKKRLEILERDSFKCLRCDETEIELHVHHRYYVSKREPWDYPSFAYQTLCKECHFRIGEPGWLEPHMHDEWEVVINTIMKGENGQALPMAEAFHGLIQDGFKSDEILKAIKNFLNTLPSNTHLLNVEDP